MPRIRCFYEDCVFLAKGFCGASSIEVDPEDGCLTYSEDPADRVNEDSLVVDEDDLELELEESWDDAGFEEIDGVDFSDDEDY